MLEETKDALLLAAGILLVILGFILVYGAYTVKKLYNLLRRTTIILESKQCEAYRLRTHILLLGMDEKIRNLLRIWEKETEFLLIARDNGLNDSAHIEAHEKLHQEFVTSLDIIMQFMQRLLKDHTALLTSNTLSELRGNYNFTIWLDEQLNHAENKLRAIQRHRIAKLNCQKF